MRGQALEGRSPELRLAARIRELSDAVRRLEHRRTLPIGGWRIEDINGVLCATEVSSGRRYALTPEAVRLATDAPPIEKE